MADSVLIQPSEQQLQADLAAAECRRVMRRLKFYFATLSCLGGMVLGSGNDTQSIAVIAVFFAVFGYLFVDWLELFALPPLAAYAAMALAALYCISDFSNLNDPGNRQMEAVAQLLVFVQSILMLQKKSRRIFEQLGVFCLLELIVAAVFNDAVNFGLLLVPIAIIGAWALSLMAAAATWEGIGPTEESTSDNEDETVPAIHTTSPETMRSLTRSAKRLPRVALFALAPAVTMVAVIFFYALPRTTDAARITGKGNALVGFSDHLHLGQIGTMLQSSDPALRIHLQHEGSGLPYRLSGGMYLRGRTLESYQASDSSYRVAGVWRPTPKSLKSGSDRLPDQYFPSRTSDRNFFDSVVVNVTCEAVRSPSLFAMAPYHGLRTQTGVVHLVDRWTLERRDKEETVFPRLGYTFGSNAFRDGQQTDLIARETLEDLQAQRTSSAAADRVASYRRSITSYEEDLIPSAGRLAEAVVNRIPRRSRTQYRIAKEFELYLSNNPNFRYTLDLSGETLPGVDPIEQFLSRDRKGHCQYFASALVMMLRSQGIPARVVVGYHTDEYNELLKYYVARQLHAHAWVEALVDRDQLPATRAVYGQPEAQQYWLRLDPTPNGGGVGDSQQAGGVRQTLDLVQNMWDDYVVEMDGNRQDAALLNSPGLNPMSQSYSNLIDQITAKVAQLRAGELGGGSLASGELFSLPAAVVFFVVAVTGFFLARLLGPAWIRKRARRSVQAEIARPALAFYAATLDELERGGWRRQAGQTPRELAVQVNDEIDSQAVPAMTGALGLITQTFYRLRFGEHSAQDDAVEDNVREAMQVVRESVDRFARRPENDADRPDST